MSRIVRIQTVHGSDLDEKATLFKAVADFPEFTATKQREIVAKMLDILKKKGKKNNWMTGLDADKTLKEQYESFIDKDITMEEFKYFTSIVPKGEFGTSSIVSIIITEVDNWQNRLD